MRFLANAHLVVLGLLSLGITAYAQTCHGDRDCEPNERCVAIGPLRVCGPPLLAGLSRAMASCDCPAGLTCEDGECVEIRPVRRQCDVSEDDAPGCDVL
ncbi:hypothetical protein DFH08DRAFT_965102 [Mycena albidolilacea]|uniref:Dickkopf N-terminal cysteine-rich domain-containing protein n=1 Tax=Mycena albidolilacea TaxID=1033008 RepID=A0AAD6ZRH2_9AGAR|nr:hypothetical protein DFH08DRAFT_965102 [Mycena albidolilacea]